MNKGIRFAFLACAAAALCAVGCENNKTDDASSTTGGQMGVVSGEKGACCIQKECDTTQGECADKAAACAAEKGQCADKAATCETKN